MSEPPIPEARVIRAAKEEPREPRQDGGSESQGDELAGLIPVLMLLLIFVLALVNAME